MRLNSGKIGGRKRGEQQISFWYGALLRIGGSAKNSQLAAPKMTADNVSNVGLWPGKASPIFLRYVGDLTDRPSGFEVEFSSRAWKMGAYDPETLILLRNALDEAWSSLSDERKAKMQKSEMAHRILQRASEGERDPVRLRFAAVIGAAN